MTTATPQPLTPKPFRWRLWLILVVAALITVIMVTPYSLTLSAPALANSPVPLPVLLAAQWLQAAILFGVVAALGLLVANRIGLGLPFLESWLAGKPDWTLVRRFILPAILAGLAVGVAIVALDQFVFSPALAADLKQLGITIPPISLSGAPAWQGFLASFYGGVTEEILLRLFVLSVLAWLGRFVNRTATGRPGLIALWAANVLAAVLFGLGHLPATVAAGMPLDALVVTRAIVLNGVGGLVFGWFYWTYGLEAAMVGHFSADIVLHVVMPLLAGN